MRESSAATGGTLFCNNNKCEMACWARTRSQPQPKGSIPAIGISTAVDVVGVSGGVVLVGERSARKSILLAAKQSFAQARPCPPSKDRPRALSDECPCLISLWSCGQWSL